MKRDLTGGPLFKESFSFGLPLALGTATHALFNLVDLKLVGFLGQDAVAAVHVGSVVNFIPMILANGIGVGSVSLISRYLGSGAREKAKEVSNRALYSLVVLGLLLGIAGFFAARPLVRFQNAEGLALQEGVTYLKILSLGTVTMFVLLQVTTALRGMGAAYRPVFLLTGANLLNLLLDLLLIFGWEPLGIPAMGVAGAAWGTVIARGLGALVGLALLRRRDCPLRIERTSWSGLAGELGRLLRIGLPQSTQMLVRALAVLYITRLAAGMGGVDALAAISVGVRMDMVLFFSAAGWGAAASAFVGYNLGARKVRRCMQAGRLYALFAACMGLVLMGLYAWFAPQILHFFIENPSPAVVQEGVLYFRLAVLSYPTAAIALTLGAAINGAGATLGPMVIDAIGHLGVLLPVTSTFATIWKGSYDLGMLWLTLVVFNALMALVYLVYFQKRTWLKRRL